MEDYTLKKQNDMLLLVFEKARQTLSTQQFNILQDITFDGGLKDIVAGAGGGKTRVLTFIVLKALIDSSINGLALLTTTKGAKDEAFNRYTALYDDIGFGNQNVKTLNIHHVKTIHSVALRHARLCNAKKDGAGISVVGKSKLINMLKSFLTEALETHAKSVYGRGKAKQTDIVTTMQLDDAANLLYNVRAERLRNCLPVVDKSLGPIAYQTLNRLNQEMQCEEFTGQQLYDFDLMISDLAQSMMPLVPKGNVLIIDEAQDLSYCQVKIVINTLLAGACVVVLGDDSQGIFQFSGALSNTIHELRTMATKHSIKTKQFTLMQNHRSSDAVVKVSEQFLPQEDRELRSDTKGNGSTNYPVEGVLCHSTTSHIISRRIADLIQSEKCEPGDFVILRHKRFGYGDELVKNLLSETSKRGLCVPITIMGQDVAATMEMKTASIIQMAVGLEHFVDSPDEGMQTVRVFLRGLRGARGAPPDVVKAIEAVWQQKRCDPSRLFTHHADALLSELDCIDDEDNSKQHDQTFTSSSVRPSKRQCGLNGKQQKKYNFEQTIQIASTALTQVRERIDDITKGIHLRPILPTDDKQQLILSCDTTLNLCKESQAHPKHPLGALAFRVLHDLVDHKLDDYDNDPIKKLVEAYDVPIATNEVGGIDRESVDSHLITQTTALIAVLNDKETAGKIIFSTIHGFKGRERPCAVVVEIKEPQVSTTYAQRASLSHMHEPTCQNLDGAGRCKCSMYLRGLQRMNKACVSEQLRLYYVAASRAKERLFLCFSGHSDKMRQMCPDAATTAGVWVECTTA